jgi:hypothetical protein
VLPNSQYAVVEMVENPLEKKFRDGTNFKAHAQSKIFYKSKIWQDDRNMPVLALVNVDTISSPCIGVKFSSDPTDPSFLFMKPRSSWPALLAESMIESINNGKKLL